MRNIPEKGKRLVPVVESQIESQFIYPLLRWSDVRPFHAVPTAHLILAQDAEARRGIPEERLKREAPRTFAYLEQFRSVLADRAAYRRYQLRGAFYSMYDVGPYTLAPVKVVWRRMDRRITAAVVESRDDPRLGLRPIVPQETCVLVAVESTAEAYYLCALLNSAVAGFLVRSQSVRGGKSFGTPSILRCLSVGRFDAEIALHRCLSAAGRAASGAESASDEIRREIDELARQFWGLSTYDLGRVVEEMTLG